ncbi:hypothetical protein N7445_009127 [Penicillium cf. griseofulvum]|nr:hypothetical protein N7445_009127 [Penicillium cf. griseofulvum]
MPSFMDLPQEIRAMIFEETDASPTEKRDMSVENLILNFQSVETELPYPPDDMDYLAWVHIHNGLVDKSNSATLKIAAEIDEAFAYKTRPGWLLHYFADWLEDITMNYELYYGKRIYKKIGTIAMLVDGRLETTIDLADKLAKLYLEPFVDTAGRLNPLESQLEWKKATLLRREVSWVSCCAAKGPREGVIGSGLGR